MKSPRIKCLCLTCMVFICAATAIQAAPKKKPREKPAEPVPATVPVEKPVYQGVKDSAFAKQVSTPVARDTVVKSPVALNSPANDEADRRPSSSNAYQPEPSALDQEGFIKPGEAIRIYAFPDTGTFINGFYPVDGQGRIYLPIIGKMDVTHITEKAFLDTLKSQYINYLRYPNIQIRHSIRISLLGGFHRPGLYYIDPDFSLWDAVYLAGGTMREDGLKRMQWERDRTPVAIDVIPYYQSGQSLRTIGFQSGDQLWTPVEPKRSWWEIAVRDVILSQVFPIITTSTSLYISYLAYRSYRQYR
jgi:protein involved in polysaccharide export with SLBB domain